MDEDPWCDYQPQAVSVIKSWQPDLDTITWSGEAEKRLGKIPGFIRKIVRKKAEAYVQEKGEILITCDHLNEMTARRFGGRKPHRPGSLK
jgi:hypothetical protein